MDLLNSRFWSYKEFNVDEDYHLDWDRFKIWDFTSDLPEAFERAYSRANYPSEQGIVMLNVRIASPPPPSWAASPQEKCLPIFSISKLSTKWQSLARLASSLPIRPKRDGLCRRWRRNGAHALPHFLIRWIAYIKFAECRFGMASALNMRCCTWKISIACK